MKKRNVHSYYEVKSTQWFPRRCCPSHIASGKREVGRFRLEFKCTEMISLCSKSYIIENEERKEKFPARVFLKI